MKDNSKKQKIILSIFGIIPVIWLSLLIAPYTDGGLVEIIENFSKALNNPFSITLCKNSLKVVLFLLLFYGLALGIYFSTRKNYRRNEEYGSAKWGNAQAICKKYKDSNSTQNKILTQKVCIGLDGRKHRRNLNLLICGGSGAGKTRFFAKPNVMQCNTSMVILDPKGEILRDTGELLEKKGYSVKVLDLINMDKSHCYNPFVYLKSDNDVQKLVTNLFKSTTPKDSQSNDPFWDTAASMLLLSLIFYLWYEAPEEEQNFTMVMEMLRAGDVIEKFNLESLSKLTMTDELELETLGEKKTALFALIPDNDTSFNFIVSILYTQLFQQLFYSADHKHGGRLPVHVHFIMDEFANVSLPDDFDKILSVMRSREVSVSIILQNLAQLKALFEKQWESIIGNCDSFLYLGGNEQSTHKYISELMGKENLDLNTYGKSHGRNGSYSTNYQQTGRDLMTPDEVRMLDNKYAILFIRGERPIKDLKYDILKHPNINLTTDGKAKPYIHGKTNNAIATITVDYNVENYKYNSIQEIEQDYEIISSEDMDKYLEERNG